MNFEYIVLISLPTSLKNYSTLNTTFVIVDTILSLVTISFMKIQSKELLNKMLTP